jgi:hypothetical protein
MNRFRLNFVDGTFAPLFFLSRGGGNHQAQRKKGI